MGKAVTAHPALLSLSRDAKLVPTVEYLLSIGMRQVGRALGAQPSVLSLSIEANLKPKVAFFHSIGLDRAPGGLGAQLDGYPALLTLSLEVNLRPTAEVLAAAGLLAASDRAAPTALRPRHLAASLSGRVLPRLAFCEARQVVRSAESSADEPRPTRPTLSSITTVSDAAFAKQMGASKDEYDAFKEAWSSRGNRSSDSGLAVSWLPDGMDLEALILQDDERREGRSPADSNS